MDFNPTQVKAVSLKSLTVAIRGKRYSPIFQRMIIGWAKA